MRLCYPANMPPCNGSQLSELRSAHALQNILSRCNLLRKDMRRALREGGQVSGAFQPIAGCRCCPRSVTGHSDEMNGSIRPSRSLALIVGKR